MSRDRNFGHLRLRISIQGTVQGFGLRPNVYRLAQRLRLTGFVRNVDAGVKIEVQGSPEQIDSFMCQFKAQRPEAAIVTTESTVQITSVDSIWFEILPDIRVISSSEVETKFAQLRATAHLKSQDDR